MSRRRNRLSNLEDFNLEDITSNINNRTNYQEILFSKINPDSNLNVRNEIKYSVDPDLHELAYSIARFGLRQPIIVYKKDTENYILHGRRRFSAISLINELDSLNYLVKNKPFEISKEIKSSFKSIPCIVIDKPTSDTERILQQLAENQSRKDVDNLELSEIYFSLMTENDWKQTELADHLGKSKQIVNNICKIKDIKLEIKKLIQEIQIYGCTLKKYDASYSKVSSNENTVKIGIKPLNKIAISKKQSQTFWDLYGSKCTAEDAKFIGLKLTKKKKVISKDQKYKDLSKQYLKMSKQIESLNGKDQKEVLEKRADISKEFIRYLLDENKLTVIDLY